MIPFPGAGMTYAVEFEGFRAEIVFHDEATLTFLVTHGAQLGQTETLPYRATGITDHVWIVVWQEPNGITVIQVEDFAAGRIISNSVFPDGRFAQRDGTFSPLPSGAG